MSQALLRSQTSELGSKVKLSAGSTSPTAIEWQLIWCYERCHKSENLKQRQHIKKVTRASHASMTLLRKGRQFAKWLDSPDYDQHLPLVIVTDWREAQPCFNAISQHENGLSHMPTDMVVLCDGPRQYMRALAWMQLLRSDLIPVHICERTSIPEGLLGGFIKRCFSPIGEESKLSEPGTASGDEAKEADLTPTDTPVAADCDPIKVDLVEDEYGVRAMVDSLLDDEAIRPVGLQVSSTKGSTFSTKPAPLMEDVIMNMYAKYMMQDLQAMPVLLPPGLAPPAQSPPQPMGCHAPGRTQCFPPTFRDEEPHAVLVHL